MTEESQAKEKIEFKKLTKLPLGEEVHLAYVGEKGYQEGPIVEFNGIRDKNVILGRRKYPLLQVRSVSYYPVVKVELWEEDEFRALTGRLAPTVFSM